eukprot:TRINITY_DN2989_c0_g2_i1.p1 TRINITY_DN2989_c0_g2~~TRINITY_DN2989_c0_g2_i1.p1  ORF type:complete len:337 (+),score=104.47 TRINITY_DN2989_c0_g2_i1:79-1011(+)
MPGAAQRRHPAALPSTPRSSASAAGSPRSATAGSVTQATQQLHAALAGHYNIWQDAQREKVERFVTEALAAGLESMHEPPRWGQGSVRFLSEDGEPPRPSWHSHENAIEELREMIVESLARRNITSGYRLEHAERDFAKGYRPFVSFRLCCDEGRSVERWRARQAERARTYVAEALRLMIDSAHQGNSEVWAKIPSGRYGNFLSKDEPWPTWLGRERAVHEIKTIVRAQLEAQGMMDGYQLEAQGTPMSGTWFKISYSIPLPRAALGEQISRHPSYQGGSMQRKVSDQKRRSSASMPRPPSGSFSGAGPR